MLILLDGLDEVPLANLKDCCDAIDELREYVAGFKSEGTQLIVTGRVQLRTLLDEGFISRFNRTFEIRGLNPNSIFLFLRKWPFARNVSAEAARVFSNIERSASLRQMCSNPLVLAMYVARDQLYGSAEGARSVRLPENRTDFYGEIVKELILYRRDENIGSISAGSFAKRWRQDLLARVALEHIEDEEQPANSLSWAAAVERVQKDRQMSRQAADEEFRRIAIETGIISEERRGESFRFLHLTVCEYLAARELVDQGGDVAKQFVRRATEQITAARSQRLAEVAIFTTCLVSRNDRQQLLDWFVAEANIDSRLLIRIIHESGDLSCDRVRIVRERIAGEMEADTAEKMNSVLGESIIALCSDSLHQTGDDYFSTGTPISDVVAELAGSDSQKFVRLFPSYFSNSPEVAVVDAEQRGLDARLLRADFLSMMISGPDTVTYARSAIQDSENSSTERERWVTALAESALRYTLVAHLLAGVSDSTPLQLEGDSGAARWMNKGPASKTLYGRVLAEALCAIDSYEKGADEGLYRLGLLNYANPKKDEAADVLNLEGGSIVRGRISNLYVVAPLGGEWAVWGAQDRDGDAVEISIRKNGGAALVGRSRSDMNEPLPIMSYYGLNSSIETLMKMETPRPVKGFRISLKGSEWRLRRMARVGRRST